jgi:flagellin-like protein
MSKRCDRKDSYRKLKNKKAISPIISTVILIMIVVILAIIILLWARGFLQEAILKEISGTEKRVQQFCGEVGITRIVEGDSFGFTNSGNVPIYKVNLKTTSGGTSTIEEIAPDAGGLVNPGFATIFEGKKYSDYSEIKVIPIILGKSKSGGINQFPCPEKNGFVI